MSDFKEKKPPSANLAKTREIGYILPYSRWLKKEPHLHIKNMPIITMMVVFAAVTESFCCSAFCLRKGDQPLVGRDYDWSFDRCLAFVNKRNVSKTAFTYYGDPVDNPAAWTSKYGSVTFAQYGCENGFVGMNEAGLVVHQLYLSEGFFPAPDSRPSVSMDQWVQYQLDNYSTVSQVIASNAVIRIREPSSNFSRVHFFVSDRSGASAVLDFLNDGNNNSYLAYHTGADLPYAAITNDTYDNSLAYLRAGSYVKGSVNSLDRFCRAATMVNAYDTSWSIGTYGFAILDSVAQGSTKYNIEFDPKNLYVLFRTHTNRKICYFNLASFSMSCQTPIKVLEVNTTDSADVTKEFVDYTTALNSSLIEQAWTELGVTVTQPALDAFAGYPMTESCMDLSVKEPSNPGRSPMIPRTRAPAPIYDLLGRQVVGMNSGFRVIGNGGKMRTGCVVR